MFLKNIDLHAEAQVVASSRTSVGGILSIFVYLAVVAYTCVLVILDENQPDIVTVVSAVGFLREPVSLTIKAQDASIVPLFKTAKSCNTTTCAQAGFESPNSCEEALALSSSFKERTLNWQLHPFDPLPSVNCTMLVSLYNQSDPLELDTYKVQNSRNKSDSMLVGNVSLEEYTFTTCPLPRALASGVDFVSGGFLISFPTASKDNNITIGDHVLPKHTYELGYNRSYVCDAGRSKQFAGLQIEGTSLRATREIRDGTTSPWNYKITEGLSRMEKNYVPEESLPFMSAGKFTKLPQRKLHQAFPTECALETNVCYLIALKIPSTIEYTTTQYTEQRTDKLTLLGAGLGTFGAFKVITSLMLMLPAKIGGKSTTVVPKSETA